MTIRKVAPLAAIGLAGTLMTAPISAHAAAPAAEAWTIWGVSAAPAAEAWTMGGVSAAPAAEAWRALLAKGSPGNAADAASVDIPAVLVVAAALLVF